MFLSFPDTPSVPLAISHDARLWRPWLLEKGESQGFVRGFNELLGNAKNQKNQDILETRYSILPKKNSACHLKRANFKRKGLSSKPHFFRGISEMLAFGGFLWLFVCKEKLWRCKGRYVFKVDKTHVLENSCRMPLNGGKNFKQLRGPEVSVLACRWITRASWRSHRGLQWFFFNINGEHNTPTKFKMVHLENRFRGEEKPPNLEFPSCSGQPAVQLWGCFSLTKPHPRASFCSQTVAVFAGLPGIRHKRWACNQQEIIQSTCWRCILAFYHICNPQGSPPLTVLNWGTWVGSG